MVSGIEEGAAEIGICSGATETRALETFHYRHDHLVLVMRSDHPLAGRDALLFTDTLDFDHIGLHTASSIYLRMQLAAAEAGKPLRLRINVPGFDAVCRMVQAGMGLGLIPDRAFEVVGRGMGLCAVRLRDDWARRELKIVVRDRSQLSAPGASCSIISAPRTGEARAVPRRDAFCGGESRVSELLLDADAARWAHGAHVCCDMISPWMHEGRHIAVQ